jgi:hypothetical protein
MKKLSGIILTAAFTALFAGQVFSQNETTVKDDQQVKQTTATAQTCSKMVDNDKNGVCDNYEARGKDGKGANFVDANGDGICDHNPDCKGTCNGKEGCCKGQQNCGQKTKEEGCQHRHSCAGQCAGQKTPEKK